MSEAGLRTLGVALVFGVMALWELAAPARRAELPRRVRWPGTLGIGILSTALERLAFPAAAVGGAIWAEAAGLGLFHHLSTSRWVSGPVSFLVLDLAIWGQHLAFHHVPLLWRVHSLHHTDPHLDVTSAVRFHPVEILLSMMFKLAVIVVLGAPPAAVLVFEMALNLGAMVNHANVRLWPPLERVLRQIVITPEAHRLHHSIRPEETNRNFGFTLSLWDRLAGVWRDAPAGGPEGLVLGLPDGRTARDQRLDQLLLQPFRRRA